MILQQVNLSIDPPDFHQVASHQKEKLPINEIESITEWLAGGLFDLVFPEHEDNESNSSLKSIDWFFTKTETDLPSSVFIGNTYSCYVKISPASLGTPPNIPPPKA